MGWTAGGLISGRGRDLLLFATESRPVLRPTKPATHYPIGTGGCFPENKAAGWSTWPLSSLWCRG